MCQKRWQWTWYKNYSIKEGFCIPTITTLVFHLHTVFDTEKLQVRFDYLEKGELIAMETKDGKIGVTKWKDKRYVTIKCVREVYIKKSGKITQPEAIIDHNTGKSSMIK